MKCIASRQYLTAYASKTSNPSLWKFSAQGPWAKRRISSLWYLLGSAIYLIRLSAPPLTLNHHGPVQNQSCVKSLLSCFQLVPLSAAAPTPVKFYAPFNLYTHPAESIMWEV